MNTFADLEPAPAQISVSRPSTFPRRQLIKSCLIALTVIDLLILAAVGGLLNRARGGWLTLDPLTYWQRHILGRMIMAVPTGALCSLVSRKPFLGLAVGLATWASIYVGWGAYFSIGRDVNGYNSRSGCFDWLLGRQEQSWSFERRWARDFTGMSLRGLVWTTPAGYLIWLSGFGWEYALSGAAMGVIYNLGFNINSTFPNFETGSPLGELLWGSWIWLGLLVTFLTRPESYQHTGWRLNLEKSIHVLLAIFSVFGLASCYYYGAVKQTDMKNQGQTMFGLVTSVVIVVAAQLWRFFMYRIHRMHQAQAVSASTPLINAHESEPQRVSPWWHMFWPVHGNPPYAQLKTIIGNIGLITTSLAVIMSIIVLIWNIHTPRYISDV
eukprot:m.45415 g.45415  ORF g.45415 m.45415 type:complete len:382 (-) comp17400_c0_seq1:132-1277(-)